MHARNHHVSRNIPRTRLQVIKNGVETVENISNNSNRVKQDQINSRQVGSVHDLCRIRVQVIGSIRNADELPEMIPPTAAGIGIDRRKDGQHLHDNDDEDGGWGWPE